MYTSHYNVSSHSTNILRPCCHKGKKRTEWDETFFSKKFTIWEKYTDCLCVKRFQMSSAIFWVWKKQIWYSKSFVTHSHLVPIFRSLFVISRYYNVFLSFSMIFIIFLLSFKVNKHIYVVFLIAKEVCNWAFCPIARNIDIP